MTKFMQLMFFGFVLFFGLAPMLQACGVFGSEPVKWPNVVQCAPDATELVGEVSEVLLSGKDVTDKLTSIAKSHTPEAVICVVDLLLRKWTAPGAAASPQRTEGADAARAFLADVGSRVEPQQ